MRSTNYRKHSQIRDELPGDQALGREGPVPAESLAEDVGIDAVLLDNLRDVLGGRRLEALD